MYARQAIEIMENRGFSPRQIDQFFAVWPDKGRDYTVEMIDQFEFSVNGPVMGRNHPELYRKS